MSEKAPPAGVSPLFDEMLPTTTTVQKKKKAESKDLRAEISNNNNNYSTIGIL